MRLEPRRNLCHQPERRRPLHSISSRGSFGAAWRDFAAFLFAEKASFDGLGPHIDQVSFALALCSTDTPYSHFSTNTNFPTHSKIVPLAYDQRQPIQVLHYHWELNDFGFVSSQLNLPGVEEALEAVNRCAIAQHDIAFYERFKRGRVKAVQRSEAATEQTAERKFAEWTANTGRRPTIMFHVGTPKTGTKSLQFLLESNRTQLAEQGIWYPDTQGHPELKHQFLVGQLMSNDGESLMQSLMTALDAMPGNTDKVVFSTEGLFNHWWDFSAEGRSVLRSLASVFPVEFIVCFRDPVAFAISLYCNTCSIHPSTRVTAPMSGSNKYWRDSWFGAFFIGLCRLSIRSSEGAEERSDSHLQLFEQRRF